MKSSLFVAAIISAIAGPASAVAATSYNFDTYSSNTLFTGGSIQGWTQVGANPPSVGGVDFPIAYITPGDTGNAGVIGTIVGNTPDNSSTTLIAGISEAGAIPGSTFSANLGIVDDDQDAFLSRDTFSLSINSPTLEIASLIFTPNLDATLWDISVSTGGGTPAGVSGSTIAAGSNYAFFIFFTSEGVRFTYGTAADGSGTNLIADLTTNIAEGQEFTSLSIVHTPNGAVGSSRDGLVFDNINFTSVPEPSSTLLLGVFSFGMLRRRRA
jgi:hypothetical protein